MNELALFAGAGGGILGGHLLGWKTVCAVEIEDYPRRVLLQRQRDGILPRFPIWDDICTFDGRPWQGRVDIVTGGFPCQDISAAGKGEGINGERSGLWKEMARVVREVQPQFVFVENSPMLTSRGLGTVLGDLASMGFNARWCVLGADDAGAPHRRKRIWILAYSNSSGSNKNTCSSELRTDRVKQSSENTRKSRQSQDGKVKKMGDTTKQGFPDRRGSQMGGREEKPKLERSSGISWWQYDPADLPDTEKINDWKCEAGETERQTQKPGESDFRKTNWPIESHVGRVVDELALWMDFIGGIIT